MTLQRPTPLLALTAAATESVLQPVAESTARRLLAPVQGVAFWSAIVLPLTYLPILFSDAASASGPLGSDLPLVALLIVVNVLAFLLGHDHKRPADV